MPGSRVSAAIPEAIAAMKDGVRIVNRARSQGATAELCEWYKTTHVHPLFEWLPESNDALTQMLKFMDRHQKPNDPRPLNWPSPI